MYIISVLFSVAEKAEQMRNGFKKKVKTYQRLHHQYYYSRRWSHRNRSKKKRRKSNS